MSTVSRLIAAIAIATSPALADGVGGSISPQEGGNLARYFDGGLNTMVASGGGGNITCAQGTTFLGRTAGIDAAHQTAYQNTICHLVNDNIITGSLTGATGGCGTLLDGLYLMATQTAAAAALNICGTSYGLVTNGAPVFTARSIIFTIFCAFASESDPPKTVKSCANTNTCRP